MQAESTRHEAEVSVLVIQRIAIVYLQRQFRPFARREPAEAPELHIDPPMVNVHLGRRLLESIHIPSSSWW